MDKEFEQYKESLRNLAVAVEGLAESNKKVRECLEGLGFLKDFLSDAKHAIKYDVPVVGRKQKERKQRNLVRASLIDMVEEYDKHV